MPATTRVLRQNRIRIRSSRDDMFGADDASVLGIGLQVSQGVREGAAAARVRRPGRVCQYEVDGGMSGGAALVARVQTADFRERHHATFRKVLDASCRWCVFGQSQMCPRQMIVEAVTRQESP